MAKTEPLSNKKEILKHYIQVIDNAKSECIIVTPYYQSIPEIEEAIDKAINRGVRIKIFGRKGEEEQFEDFYDLKNVELHFKDHLHAKIVRNEEEIVTASMNLTESSVGNNIETGTYSTDTNFIHKFEEELDWLRITPPKKTTVLRTVYQKQQYCKLCGRPKRYKPDEPLCLDCYDETLADDIDCGERVGYRSDYCYEFEKGYKSARGGYGYSGYNNYRNGYHSHGRGGYGGRGRGGYGGYGYW